MQLLSYSQISFSLPEQKNILDGELQVCSTDPMTGWSRSGKCESYSNDRGTHFICAKVNDDFLTYTKSMGNDLSTPSKTYRFPGLVSGDHWCLCVFRWLQAKKDGHAPDVILDATNHRALDLLKRVGKNLKDLE